MYGQGLCLPETKLIIPLNKLWFVYWTPKETHAMTIEHYLMTFYLQTFLSVVVSVLCFIKFRDRTLQIRLIGFIFLTSFVANVVGNLMIKWQVTRPFTNTTYPVYQIVHLAILSKIYCDLFHQNSRWHIVTVGIFTSFALTNLFFWPENATQFLYIYFSFNHHTCLLFALLLLFNAKGAFIAHS